MALFVLLDNGPIVFLLFYKNFLPRMVAETRESFQSGEHAKTYDKNSNAKTVSNDIGKTMFMKLRPHLHQRKLD